MLVGADEAIPSDPRTYYQSGGPLIPCSHLVCGKCGADVRHFDGYQLKRDLLSGDEFGQLAATTDPNQFPLLRKASVPTIRFYFCKCFNFYTAGAVSAPSRDDCDWACAGH
jgi:hypothetical protein